MVASKNGHQKEQAQDFGLGQPCWGPRRAALSLPVLWKKVLLGALTGVSSLHLSGSDHSDTLGGVSASVVLHTRSP